MKKEQLLAAVEAIGGEENIGGIQINNEPEFWVQPYDENDPDAITGVQIDEENELVKIMRARKVLRVYGFDTVTFVRGKEYTRDMEFPKHNPWSYPESVLSQTPNRKYGC